MTGESPRQIRQQLRAQGLHPIEVDGIAQSSPRQGGKARTRVSTAQLALVTRQLATLLRSGIPLEQSLRAIEEQVHGRQLHRVIAAIRSRITEGSPLHKALAEFPGVFPEMYQVMVEAGESSGKLDEVLGHLATYTEQHQNLHRKLGVALIYPALVTLVAVVVVIALMTYVVPEIVRVFEQTGQQLPLLTRAMITSSDFICAWGPTMAIAGVVASLGWCIAMTRPGVRWYRDRLYLLVPGCRYLVTNLQAARLSRALAILTRSGVPLLDALRIGSRMISNLPLREATAKAAVKVREGGRFQRAIAEAGYFPPLLLHMLAAGEDSGELEEMLERAATSQERELESVVATVGAVLEPLIILVMGVVVLLIVLAILMPIFDMNQIVGQ